MPTKTLELPEIGSITVYKRRGARSIRLSIREDTVRVTVPLWLPYQAGIEFASSHRDWIVKHRVKRELITHGAKIGKYHDLIFQHYPVSGPTSRTRNGQIIIKLPLNMSSSDDEAQAVANRAAVRALKREAEELLPTRLRRLANAHGFSFKSVEIKRLKSRWGSCNHQREIVLNCFLMQLPWQMIDYVMLHELLHTRIMAHGPKFWTELATYVPELKQVRKYMRAQRPLLINPISRSSMS